MWIVERCFFFKQKTAYEMRISDWSSDVCSSDLRVGDAGTDQGIQAVGHGGEDVSSGGFLGRFCRLLIAGLAPGARPLAGSAGEAGGLREIGRASCRERVCQYV